MTTVTVANASFFRPGDMLVVSGLTPRLPDWVMRRPWQDGDQAIVRWFYRIVGWKLPTSFKARVASTTQTGITLR